MIILSLLIFAGWYMSGIRRLTLNVITFFIKEYRTGDAEACTTQTQEYCTIVEEIMQDESWCDDDVVEQVRLENDESADETTGDHPHGVWVTGLVWVDTVIKGSDYLQTNK